MVTQIPKTAKWDRREKKRKPKMKIHGRRIKDLARRLNNP